MRKFPDPMAGPVPVWVMLFSTTLTLSASLLMCASPLAALEAWALIVTDPLPDSVTYAPGTTTLNGKLRPDPFPGVPALATGLAVPLIFVLCSVLAEAAVHRAVLTQAFVWLNSASAAGSAGAAAVAGWAVGTFGAHGGFAVAAMATSVMAVLTVAGLRALPVPQQQAAATQSAE